ncbi:MAG: hypothetical protein CR997_07180 [Acidobacteria bacterium]|nr:MAG: hypothetical protein CR997_07180 [Acidobacteriota bacterium]
MRKSTSSLLFTLLFTLITVWIVWVALQDKDLKEEDPVKQKKKAFWSTAMEGENIRYKSFNDQGEWTLEIQAQKSEILKGDQKAISEIRAVVKKTDGSILHIHADFYQDDGPNKVFSSKENSTITLKEEGGLQFESKGPLIITPDQELITENKADFKLGNWSGSGQTLYYIPDSKLMLNKDVFFNFSTKTESTSIVADQILVNLKQGAGRILNGKYDMVSSTGQSKSDTTALEAEKMAFFFTGGQEDSPFSMTEVNISGPNSRIFWNEGGLISRFFSICMDEKGMFPQWITTSNDTEFTIQSVMGQSVTGTTGSMNIEFLETQPVLLKGETSIHIQSTSTDGEVLTLKGSKGFNTEFNGGRAENTRIFGTPEFQYDTLKGTAGFFRVLHGQRKLILSQTAEITSEENQIHVTAEEILVSKWDLPDREIFGRAFIHFTSKRDGRAVHGYGNEILINEYQEEFSLKGSPARLEDGGSHFSAQEINVANFHSEDTVARALQQVQAVFFTNETSYKMICQSMALHKREGHCQLNGVKELHYTEDNTLSAEKVDLFFTQEKPVALKSVLAEGNIQIKGSSWKEGKLSTFSGQSELLEYVHATQVLTLESNEGEVVLQNNDGYVTKGRRLIYSLLDDTMRVEASEHGSTQTIVNIKKEKSH